MEQIKGLGMEANILLLLNRVVISGKFSLYIEHAGFGYIHIIVYWVISYMTYGNHIKNFLATDTHVDKIGKF